MNAPAPAAPEPIPQPRAATRWRRWIGGVVGAALLVAAIVVVARQGQSLGSAWSALRAAPAWLVALAVVLPIANNAAVAAAFLVHTRAYVPVPAREMAAMIGAAWLLNYLPMKAGLLSRAAYHRACHGLAIASFVRITVLGLACAAGGALSAVGIAFLLRGADNMLAWAGGLATPLVLATAAHAALRARGVRTPMPAVFALRYLDFLIWIARYAVAFRLVGEPIGLPAAAAIAAVSQLAVNVPLSGNGLGLREWAVGVTSSSLPPGLAGGSVTTAVGLAADLANRAAELVAAVPVGLLSLAWLARHRARAGA